MRTKWGRWNVVVEGMEGKCEDCNEEEPLYLWDDEQTGDTWVCEECLAQRDAARAGQGEGDE